MIERRAIAVQGTVQGVGFRPFVHALARHLHLGGFVRNQAGAVQIEVEGETEPIERFLEQMRQAAPVLARIDDVQWSSRPPRGERQFHIQPSNEHGDSPVTIAPDVATCDACLAEMWDPRDRRHLYPFINCTNCGPRLTIVTGAPYDRARTTMACYPMCAACHAEYEAPADRRFHAQPIACPQCGPRLEVRAAGGQLLPGGSSALQQVAGALRAGKIVALKGMGGYQLACAARNAAAVTELRRRKHREEKPFAVMVADLDATRALGVVAHAEATLLTSSPRPIVLLRKHETCGLANSVAPANPFLGVMLPCAPLHHLLLREMNGAPLVMTSGNRAEEPIAFTESEAFANLGDIADVFLVHDRAIHVRCDDSVVRIMGRSPVPVRRARGYAPQPIALPMTCPEPILAVGGQLKSTFALGVARQATLSQHLGDLDHVAAYDAFVRDIGLYEELFALRPAVIAHDMHPDYAATRYALAHPALHRIAVQHHHAHMASCMAEHHLDERVIGVIFDGTGYGPDATIWGGEFLVGDYRGYVRAAHLRQVRMPGGEQAVRAPWRMAMAHLRDAQASCAALTSRIAPASLRIVDAMLARGFNAPLTSSVGRLFDAVAALVGVRDAVTYEGQAAIELEWQALQAAPDGAYPMAIVNPLQPGAPFTVDTRALIQAVAADVNLGVSASSIAWRFHQALANAILSVCLQLRLTTGIGVVVLSGGVFMNGLLTQQASALLEGAGFGVHCHRVVPPNDGGLSLGQVAIAAASLTTSALH